MAEVRHIGGDQPIYTGPICDCDSHIHGRDFFDFMEHYLPAELHAAWLVARKLGPDGCFGLHIGDRMVENVESNGQGLVPPPGKLKERPSAIFKRYAGWATSPTPCSTRGCA